MLPPARIYPNWYRPIRYVNTHKGYRVEYKVDVLFLYIFSTQVGRPDGQECRGGGIQEAKNIPSIQESPSTPCVDRIIKVIVDGQDSFNQDERLMCLTHTNRNEISLHMYSLQSNTSICTSSCFSTLSTALYTESNHLQLGQGSYQPWHPLEGMRSTPAMPPSSYH